MCSSNKDLSVIVYTFLPLHRSPRIEEARLKFHYYEQKGVRPSWERLNEWVSFCSAIILQEEKLFYHRHCIVHNAASKSEAKQTGNMRGNQSKYGGVCKYIIASSSILSDSMMTRIVQRELCQCEWVSEWVLVSFSSEHHNAILKSLWIYVAQFSFTNFHFLPRTLSMRFNS